MDDLDFNPTAPVRVAGRFRPKPKTKSTTAVSSQSCSLGSYSEVFQRLESSDHLASSAMSFDAFPNADILSGLDALDNFHTQTTSVLASTSSPYKVIEGNSSATTRLAFDVPQVQTDSGYCATQDSNEHGEMRLETKDFEILDNVSDAPITSGLCDPGKFPPKLRVKKRGKNSPIHSEFVSTTLSEATNLEVGEMDESSLSDFPPGDVHDHISPTFGDSITANPTPNSQENAENLAEATQLDEPVSNGVAHSQGVCGRGHESGDVKASRASNRPQTLKASAENKVANDEKLIRKSRKRLPHQEVDDLGTNTSADSFNAETSSDFDANEDMVNVAERKKRAPRKSKIPVSENEQPNQTHKRNKKEQTKKFSHSTRRNRRQVDKSLLEIPEDEIDPQKVRLKDLIRLEEYRERTTIKEAAKLKASASNQSTHNEFQKDPSHYEEEDSVFEQDRSSSEGQAGYKDRISTISSSFNYQSFMNKERRSKWVQQDTDLFYEGIEQFGSDFNMIAQLFPGRTRHQIKLKFKKEDRQNPSRITEAFRRHSKDNSKYVLVINELQKVAQEKQESNADDLNDREELEPTHDYDDEVVTRPELDEIDAMNDFAAEVQQDETDAEIYSPKNYDQNDNVDGFGWDEDF